MNLNKVFLKNEEKAIYKLRSLYQKYGYMQYKMSKFEEYDLYVRNKNFLISDNIITFTDTNGKLMALKPDVTLSLIKNIKAYSDSVQKLYYNENVYRVSKGTTSYKEIMQVGLECIGNIDNYNIYEVMLLACQSLAAISDDFVLDVSHLGIISYIISSMNVTKTTEKELYKFISDKNIQGIASLCARENINCNILTELISTYGNSDEMLNILSKLDCKSEVKQLTDIVKLLESNGYKNKVRIDFSVINDVNYYNGFVFKGFINGISSGILSGGQYDNLMLKMKKQEKAIGFAVYLDLLERFGEQKRSYDVDTIILYDENTDLTALNELANKEISEDKIVSVQKNIPSKIRYKKILKIDKKGVRTIENNA